MNSRDRLIELIQSAVGGCARHWAEKIADYLIANGVILPPCKIGTILEPDDYCIEKCVADHYDTVLVTRVEGAKLPYIMTLEEVEKALERGKENE